MSDVCRSSVNLRCTRGARYTRYTLYARALRSFLQLQRVTDSRKRCSLPLNSCKEKKRVNEIDVNNGG